MAVKYFCVLAISCIFFFAGRSEGQHPGQVQQWGSHQYGQVLCQARLEQKSDQNANGQALLLNLSITPPSRESCEGTNVKKNIPQDYVHLSGSGYYKYHSEFKKFNEARKICTQEGGHLAIFNSEAEAKFVASLPAKEYEWGFIGIHDLYEEGQWVTILDEELHSTGYSQWYPVEPNLGTKENCGVAYPNGQLGDFDCGTPKSFFCEIN